MNKELFKLNNDDKKMMKSLFWRHLWILQGITGYGCKELRLPGSSSQC